MSIKLNPAVSPSGLTGVGIYTEDQVCLGLWCFHCLLLLKGELRIFCSTTLGRNKSIDPDRFLILYTLTAVAVSYRGTPQALLRAELSLARFGSSILSFLAD